jgi:hypothetical protein
VIQHFLEKQSDTMSPEDKLVNSIERFSLGIEHESGRPYISISVASRLVDYEEFYALTPEEYLQCISNAEIAAQFARQCRAHELDCRLLELPGNERGASF